MAIKEKLKKTVNKNMLSEFIIASIFFIIAIFFSIIMLYEESQSPHYPILDLFDDFFGSIAWGLFVITPVFIGLIILIFSIISRLTFSSESKKRLIAYRIITGFLIFLMLIMCLSYSCIFINDWSDAFLAVTSIIIDLLVVTASVMVIKNTYSSKILN